MCRQVTPNYVGECGDGDSSFFNHSRFASHLGSATQPFHKDKVRPIGGHFQQAGHDPHNYLVMLPIEKICDNDSFVRKDRESFYIKKFSSRKKLLFSEIEHGLNLIKGQ